MNFGLRSCKTALTICAASATLMACGDSSSSSSESSSAATSVSAATASTGSTVTRTAAFGTTATKSAAAPATSTTSAQSSTAASSSSTTATSNSSTPKTSTAATANTQVAATTAATVLDCSSPTIKSSSASSLSASIDADVSGTDLTRTFALGSNISVTFNVHSPEPESMSWQIVNYAGTSVASGSVAIATGTSTAVVPCVANLPGYFSVTATLSKSAAVLPQKGSRPQGFASFGVLPDFSKVVPSTSTVLLASHWFGLQGTNYVETGKVDVGTGLQPINQNLGSNMAIDSGSWSQLEPSYAGQYSSDSTVLDTSFQLGNLDRLIRLDGIPAWASSAPSPSDVGSYPPKSYASFQSFVSLVAESNSRLTKQYMPAQNVNYYQVTWEPDTGNVDKWMGTDAQFVSLYQAAWQGAHASDPAAAVVGPATSTVTASISWLNRLAPLGLAKYLDAVSIHGYPSVGGPYSSNPPEAFGLPQQMQELRHSMTTLLPAKTKLLVTETGVAYPPGSRYTATFPTTNALNQQAETVVRTHLILLGEGADASFLFYSADYSTEVGFGLYFNLDMPAIDFGSPQISPKPAAMAAATMTRLLDKTTTLGALNQMPTGAYGYSFEYGDGSHALTAVWAHDAAFNASIPYAFTVDAAGTSGSVTVIDAMGNISTQSYANGVLQLTLTEMPAYVLSKNIPVLSAQVRVPEGY